MKKLLLATTAILGAVSFASVAAADAPRVTVGGFIDFQAGWADQDIDPTSAKNDYGFRNDTEIHFNIDGKTDRGLNYGAVIELEADITDDTTASGTNSDRTYIYLSGDKWGRFEMGGNTDAATALKVDASSIARATGGIDGDFFRFSTNPGGALFIVRPDLPLSHGTVDNPGITENATKITYYSPDMAGFQVGVSYTPDSDSRGQEWNGSFGPAYSDIVSGGVSYARQFSNWNLGLSATAEFGEAYNLLAPAGNDDESYALGASVGFAGFTFAGSWGNTEAATTDGKFWTLGGAYDFGAFGASVTYLSSELETAVSDNDFDNLVFGVDYALAPGFTPYAEVSMFDYSRSAGLSDNDGTIFLVGTQLAF